MNAYFEYKCRRCGTIVADTAMGVRSSDDTRPLLVLLDAIHGAPKDGQSPRMISAHNCRTGEYGVTDLIGCRLGA